MPPPSFRGRPGRRPRGTWNHKHAPPRAVRTVRHRPGLRFVLDEVEAGMRSVDVSQIEQRRRPRGHRADRRDSLLEISPTVYVRELVGHRPGRDRKVPCPFDVNERPSLHVHAAPNGARAATPAGAAARSMTLPPNRGEWGRGDASLLICAAGSSRRSQLKSRASSGGRGSNDGTVASSGRDGAALRAKQHSPARPARRLVLVPSGCEPGAVHTLACQRRCGREGVPG